MLDHIRMDLNQVPGLHIIKRCMLMKSIICIKLLHFRGGGSYNDNGLKDG